MVHLGRRNALARRRTGGVKIADRTSAERDPRRIGVVARERVHGLTPMQAAIPEAGDAIGRAFLQGCLGDLSTDAGRVLANGRLQAARMYERVELDARRASLARSMPSGGDLERISGYDASEGTEPAYVDFCENAERRSRECRHALLEAAVLHRAPLIQFAVNTWALDDKQDWGTFGDMLLGLNVLARLFAIPLKDEEVLS